MENVLKMERKTSPAIMKLFTKLISHPHNYRISYDYAKKKKSKLHAKDNLIS